MCLILLEGWRKAYEKNNYISIDVTMYLCFTSCENEKIEPLQELKGQELISESDSSDNEYTIKAYRNNGGATVIGELFY